MVKTRQDWLSLMLKIAGPVLFDLSNGKLRGTLPVEKPDRAPFAHLEAFGRMIWLFFSAMVEPAVLPPAPIILPGTGPS